MALTRYIARVARLARAQLDLLIELVDPAPSPPDERVVPQSPLTEESHAMMDHSRRPILSGATREAERYVRSRRW